MSSFLPSQSSLYLNCISTNCVRYTLWQSYAWAWGKNSHQYISTKEQFSHVGSVCILSAIRLDMIITTDFDWSDVTWAIAVISYLSTIEISLGIMCACIPTLRPLMKKIMPAMLGSSSQNPSSRQYVTRMDRIAHDSTLKRKSEYENGIYMQKDIHFQSTKELRDIPPTDPLAGSHRSSDDISLEPAYSTRSAKG